MTAIALTLAGCALLLAAALTLLIDTRNEVGNRPYEEDEDTP